MTGITDRQIMKTLDQAGERYALLPLQNGVTVLICERGGRVFGPFLTAGAESLYWVNQALGERESFTRLLASDWNLGGERLWVEPEIQYICRDRQRFYESEVVPPEMDPGNWRLEQVGAETWHLANEMTLEAYNLACGRKRLRMERLIRPAEDPLRLLRDHTQLTEGVVYAGYEQVVTLTEAEHDDILSGAWVLIQLQPGGTLWIPCSPGVEVTDHFEPIDADYQTVHPHHVALRITGQRRYKVGFKAAHVTGRLAYFNRPDSDLAYLLVRALFSNPSSVYPEEPPNLPGSRGESVHVYNDDGGYGGFGELEVHGQTIGGETGKSSSSDLVLLWLYVGAPERLKLIARHLLGIEV